MFLHIIDDTLTINHFIRRINELDFDRHQFVVITPSGQYSQVVPIEDMSPLIPTHENLHILAHKLDGYTAVFIHNLCHLKARIIIEAPEDVVFVWGVWGFDYYYNYPELYRNIFLPYTRLANILLGKLSLPFKNLMFRIHPFTKILGLESKVRIIQKAAARIHFTLNIMPGHSDLFRVVEFEEWRRFHLSYYSIERITEGLSRNPVELGDDIFIGNSASNSSNHIDVFLQLKHLIRHQNIIVPLGYGSSRYRKLINMVGGFIFKSQFKPINDHIPLNEYNKILLGCNIMIFNHKRAQGLGNILFGVWAGHKIFLRQSNPVYLYLKSIGIKVYPIESAWPAESFEPLTAKWQVKNRYIIEQLYSEAMVKNELEFLLNQMRDHHKKCVRDSVPHRTI